MEGGTQGLAPQVRSTIQFIKEIVKNHSDAEIYAALQESNMEPNETIQKLLNQDPFHEVKRKRDRRKETLAQKDSEDQQRHSENTSQGIKTPTRFDFNTRRGGYYQSAAPSNAAHGRNILSGNRGGSSSKEFRVVKDNRVYHNADQEVNSGPPQQPLSSSQLKSNTSNRGLAGTSTGSKPLGGRAYARVSNAPGISQNRRASQPNTSGNSGKEGLKDSNADAHAQTMKPTNSRSHPSTSVPSNNSAVGLYSSSTDPVHVPSLDSRASFVVGAIKRDVGVVGVRLHSSEDPVKRSSAPSASSNMHLRRAYSPSGSSRSFIAIPKTDQLGQIAGTQSSSSMVGSKTYTNNQHNGKLNQQVSGHQKASQPVKEWKPKSSKKPDVSSSGVIGLPAKSAVTSEERSKDADPEVTNLQYRLSQANIHETQNVIIAQHIRVPDTDRCQLTFGSFDLEYDSSRNFSHGGVREELNGDASTILSVSEASSSEDTSFVSKQVDVIDGRVRNSRSGSPASSASSENQLSEKKESNPQSLDSYGEIGLVRDDSHSYALSESQQQQDPPQLPSFSAYDAQAGYDIPYIRTTMEEAARGQGLLSPREPLSSHVINNIPASTIAMEQHQHQQQVPQHVAQMYPQMHVSHFANLMPYRQFIPPGVYIPPMAMPGYSSYAAYPHPSGGNGGYVLMPGGTSHLNTGGLKYGIQQFKPVPSGSPTGFGNFPSPAGYAINTPGVVGSATGLDDSSRMKYKDGNLYVSNPQDASEMWMQNQREIPGLHSTPYYNMTGQTHAAYMPSHAGHASFNAGASQSSHMQFPGMYPQQPNAHHLGPAMGGNVGVAAAGPVAQVGTYQQPQLGQFNWTTNF